MIKSLNFKLAAFALLAAVSAVVDARAQEQLRSPSDYLGYELGSKWTPHHRVMDYIRHVADHSSLVSVKKYGESNEGREMLLAFVSSREHMDRLEEIRRNNLKRTGLTEGAPAADSPAIVWLSYNVHGNEPSSSEAAMKTLYELARPGNRDARRWLRDAVVVIDPMLNPDGRQRYIQWYRQTAGELPNIHPEAREHHEPWPGGRTNHYYFDLNRDWAWLTQHESRVRVAEFQRWMPHIHVDFHEQSYEAPYYFAPAAEPFHHAITDWQHDFQYTIGKNHAAYFNKNNWLYFTREVFDLFYPSYGDTYPMFNGAIGMTYEQGGHSRAGLGILKTEGDTLTLKDRLTHHVTTGLSTVEVSARHAEEIIEEFSNYYRKSNREPTGKYKTFVIKGSNNPDKLEALFELLDRHQVAYGKAKKEQSLTGYNYTTGKEERFQLRRDDYLVSAYQPKSILARIFFEPRPELEDSVTYDITAWEQHYAFGLEGYAMTKKVEVASFEGPVKEVAGLRTEKPYAYLARWQDTQDIKMLADLLRKEVDVRHARRAFVLDGEQYAAGTLIITRTNNRTLGGRFDRLVQDIAARHRQQLMPVETGFVKSGADFGSSSVRHIAKPRVALLSGRSTSPNRVGEVWHFFDQQINYPLTLLRTDYFDDVDLHNYDVLVLPAGSGSQMLDEQQLQKVKAWVSAGGKLIALGGANKMLVDRDDFSLASRALPSDTSKVEIDTFGAQQRQRISDFNAGSIFKVRMDSTHPLAFGYDSHYFSLKLNSDAYKFLDEGWNVGVTGEESHMSGFAGYKAKERLKNTLVFGVQRMGSGSIVYLVDNPLFRAFWHNGKLLFGNAVFMVGQ
ncbi:M14 family metallopeptidase [Fodinibius sediminis]|uniref:Zinc carboxypeptidase n=1 Tax=Fodinibius sediminis TaxID=1214077 RepID=A0A521CFX0_9BACT|nr:M14 family metallopeptidase [Fodinibius sediminis]SMO58333.1 Zinc carboxypeptidase [Fodinibius sediminis]